MPSDELKRLRKDFELQAGKYSDLTLSVYVESADRTNDPPPVRQPNHKVMLWQYLGDAPLPMALEILLTSRWTDSALSTPQPALSHLSKGQKPDCSVEWHLGQAA